MSEEPSFGPFGWFKPSRKVNLAVDDISWIEEDAMWMFLFRSMHCPGSCIIDTGRVDTTSLLTWDRYRIELGSRRPLVKLRDHYKFNMAPNLHDAKMPSNIKLKLYFGLRIPLHNDFLHRLQPVATIILTADKCIEYLKHNVPGGLQLGKYQAIRMKIRENTDEDYNIWDFLYNKIFHTDVNFERKMLDVRDPKLWEEFKIAKNNVQTVEYLLERFQTVAPMLDTTSYTWQTKIKMHFALDIPVSESHLRSPPFANYELDEGNCIVSCKPVARPTRHQDFSVFTDKETNEMWKHVYRRLTSNGNRVLKSSKHNRLFPKAAKFWNDFRMTSGDKKPNHVYAIHYERNMLSNLRVQKMDKRLKISLLFAFQVPITQAFMEELSKDAYIKLNENRCIAVYKEQLKRPHSSADDVALIGEGPELKRFEFEEERKFSTSSDLLVASSENAQFTDLDDMIIWMFVVETCLTVGRDNTRESLEIPETWAGLPASCYSSRPADDYQKRFFSHLLPNLHKASLDDLVKLELYVSLQIPIHPDFVKQVRSSIGVDEDAQLLEDSEQQTAAENPENSGDIFERNAMKAIREVVESMPHNLEETNPFESEN